MLELSKLTLHLDFNAPTVLPRWMGSAFRGGFGEHLRQICCSNITRDCKRCKDVSECLFYFIFERESACRGYAPPTRPVIIVPPFFGKRLDFKDGCKLNVDVLLFGKFRDYLPQVLFALNRFGSDGLGSSHKPGMNRFAITEATCAVSRERIYDGETIHLTKLHKIDIVDLEQYEYNAMTVAFRTPIILKSSRFPPTPEKLLDLIRSRLILYVNEYGDGTKISEFRCFGDVKAFSRHLHSLERHSRRGGATRYLGSTGIAEYCFDRISDSGRWLLNVGLLLGAGPKSAFGCGFFDAQL